MDAFNFIAGISSIVGLAITVKVWWDVRRIAGRYARQALLPEFQVKLGIHLKSLKRYVQKKDPEKIRQALVICRGTLHDLWRHLHRRDQSKTEHTVAHIDRLLMVDDSVLLRESGGAIAEIEALSYTLGYLLIEMKWRLPNA